MLRFIPVRITAHTFLPEIGTEVVISFIMGTGISLFVIGSLWNKQSPIPADLPNEKNTFKTIKTKGGSELNPKS